MGVSEITPEMQVAERLKRDAYLLKRRSYLGSSDAPAVCGCSPWATPLHVYLSKLGEYDSGDSNPKRWGRKLEDVVAEAYREETGNMVQTMPTLEAVQHESIPWLAATPDRLTRVQGEPRILECKTSSQSQEWGNSGTDEVPDGYVVQVHHQMLCLGKQYRQADIAVLINGSDFRVFTVERNEQLIDRMLQIESDFWDKVTRREAPAPDWTHPQTQSLMKTMWACEEGLSLELGSDAQELCERFTRLRSSIRQATLEKADVQARLQFLVGSAGQARVPGGYVIKRRPVHRRSYPVQACDYFSFKVIAPEGLFSEEGKDE